MANTQKYLNHLLQNVGITPACSEEERAAADVIARIFSNHGFEPEVQEFTASSSRKVASAALGIVMFVSCVLMGLGGALGIAGTLLVIACCAVYFLERTGRMSFPQIGGGGLSQNVIAYHRASGPLASPRNRPVVVVAHYDSPRADFMSRAPYAAYRPLLARLQPVAMAVPAAVAVLSLLPLPGTAKVILWIASILLAFVPLVQGVAVMLNRFVLPYTSGAVCNKSSVAAMLGVMDAVSPSRTAVEFPGDRPFDEYMAEQRRLVHEAALQEEGYDASEDYVEDDEPREDLVQVAPVAMSEAPALSAPAEEVACDELDIREDEGAPAPPEPEMPAPAPDATVQMGALPVEEDATAVFSALEDDGEEGADEPSAEPVPAEEVEPALPVNIQGNVRYGADAIRALGMVPGACDIEYESGQFEPESAEPAAAPEPGFDQEPESGFEEEVFADDEGLFDAPVDEDGYEPAVDDGEELPYDEYEQGHLEDEFADGESVEADFEPMEEQDAFVEALDEDGFAQDAPEADEQDLEKGYVEEEYLDEDEPAVDEFVDWGELPSDDEDDVDIMAAIWEPIEDDEDGQDPSEEPVDDDVEGTRVFEVDQMDKTVEAPAADATVQTAALPVDDGRDAEDDGSLTDSEPADEDRPHEAVLEPVDVSNTLFDLEPIRMGSELDTAEPEMDATVAEAEPLEDASAVAEAPAPASTVAMPAAPQQGTQAFSAAPQGTQAMPAQPARTVDTVDDLMAQIADSAAPQRPQRNINIPSVKGPASLDVPNPAAPASRASLLDLPDPSAGVTDPFGSPVPRPAAPQPAAPARPSSPSTTQFTVISGNTGMQAPAAEPIETISAPAPAPAKKKRGIGGLFGRKKKQREDSMSDWLGVDDDFDAKRSGRDIGSWDNFDGDGGWKGGAASSVDMSEDELRDAVASLGDDELLGHDIWFVAAGASEQGNAGVQAFLNTHRDRLRGVFLINLECIGAGHLAMVSTEGERRVLKGDKRIKGLLSRVSADFHHEIGSVDMPYVDTDAHAAMEMSLRSCTLAGVEGSSFAFSHSEEDIPANVNAGNVALAADIVTEVIRRS